MQMMLCRTEGLETDILCYDREIAQLADHLLELRIITTNWAKPLALLGRAGHCRKNKRIEFHRSASLARASPMPGSREPRLLGDPRRAGGQLRVAQIVTASF